MTRLKSAADASYDRGVKDGRLDELVVIIRLVGKLARTAYKDPVRLRELDRVQLWLHRRQRQLQRAEK